MLCPIIQIIKEDVEQDPSSWSSVALCATNHHSLGPAVQPVFSVPHCLLIQAMLHQVLCGDLIADRVVGLTEVQVDNMYCSPLVFVLSLYFFPNFSW